MASWTTYCHPPTKTLSTAPPTLRLQALDTNASQPTQPPVAFSKSEQATSKRPEAVNSANYEVNQQHSSPFFRLPGELRNEIYNMLLCPDVEPLSALADQQKNHNTQHATHPPHTPSQLYPAILSTCRKAHLEATPLLYESHIFHAHTSLLTSMPHLTSAYRPVIHNRSIALIRRWQISLRLDTDPRFTAAQAKAAFSGAEYLEVRVWEAQFEMCDYAVLALLMGVRGVKVARVTGSVGEEVARWMEKLMMCEEGKEGDLLGVARGEVVLEKGLEDWRVGGHIISVR